VREGTLRGLLQLMQGGMVSNDTLDLAVVFMNSKLVSDLDVIITSRTLSVDAYFKDFVESIQKAILKFTMSVKVLLYICI
jgi:hypothetical protein